MMNSSQRQPSSLAEQDLELLSAYLDQELTAAERVNLERRLTGNSRLQLELEELRAVRGALRDLDAIPVPRSFALDPAKVARPRPFLPLTWFMQMGSGLAGLALVLLATVQLLAIGAFPGAPTGAPMPTTGAVAESAPMSAPANERVAEATTAPAAAQAPAPAATQDAAAMSMATEAPAAEAADQGADASGGVTASGNAAGGVPGGPESNSSPAGGMGGPPEIDITIEAMQTADASTASADTIEPMIDQAAPKQSPESATGAATPAGTNPLNPGLTLTLGLALIVLAVGWNVASRRRA